MLGMLLDQGINLNRTFGGRAKQVVGKAAGLLFHVGALRPEALADFIGRLFAHL